MQPPTLTHPLPDRCQLFLGQSRQKEDDDGR